MYHAIPASGEGAEGTNYNETVLGYDSAERQNIMALAVMGAERHLNELAGRDPDELTPETTAALAAVPGAEKWAHDFVRRVGTRDLRAEAAAKVVALAVNGIARACVDDPSADLVRLLRQAIDDTKVIAAEQAASRTTPALSMPMQVSCSTRTTSRAGMASHWPPVSGRRLASRPWSRTTPTP